jgi:hypothetical protein
MKNCISFLRVRKLFALIVILLTLSPSYVHAHTSNCVDVESTLVSTKGYGVEAIEDLDIKDCLGRNGDKNQTVSKIRDLLLETDPSKIDINSIAAVDELSNIAGIVSALFSSDISNKIRELRTSLIPGDALQRLFDLRGWTYQHTWIKNSKIQLEAICSNNQDISCQNEYNNTKNIIRVVHSVANIVSYKQADTKRKIEAIFRKRAQMGQDYVDKALPQWPWEYALTEIINPDLRVKDENGQPMGVRALPGLQFRALHLTTGLAAIGSQENSFSPTIYAEIVGVNKLFWDKEGGRLKGGLGASLIASYTPNAERDVSYGVMVHVQNKYSFAVIKNDDDYGVVASVDLVSLFQKGWAKKYFEKRYPDIASKINFK